MRKVIRDDTIIVLCGFSACGKSVISKTISDVFRYSEIVSTTTRPIRVGEEHGKDYFFTTKEDFLSSINNNEFIEYRVYHTKMNGIEDDWYYGLKKSSIENGKKYIVVLDIDGLKNLKEEFGDRIISFFIDADAQTRRNRCVNRKDFDEIEWRRRLEDDLERFPTSIIMSEVDYLIHNNEGLMNKSVAEIMERVIDFEVQDIESEY